MVDENNSSSQQAVAAEAGGEDQENRGAVLGEVLRMLGVFVFFQIVVQRVTTHVYPIGSNQESMNNRTSFTKPVGVKSSKKTHESIWEQGTLMDLDLTISLDKEFSMSNSYHNTLASWHSAGVIFNNVPSNDRNVSLTFDVPEAVHANKSMVYAHIVLTRQSSGTPLSVENEDRKKRKKKTNSLKKRDKKDYMVKTVELSKLMLRKKKRNEKNLLGDEEEDNVYGYTDEDLMDDTVLGKAARNNDEDVRLLYLKPAINLQLLNHQQPFAPGAFPPDIVKLMSFYEEQHISDDSAPLTVPTSLSSSTKAISPAPSDFYPLLHASEFWIKADSLIPVNGTLKSTTLDVTLTSIEVLKFNLMVSMEQSWQKEENAGNNADMLRTLLFDTNPILLVITFLVTLLHTVFDILAFKNDISFFKGKRSMEGLSVRTMVVNAFFQVVIFLYLVDNDTSYMVLASNGVGLVIEFWKITKAIKFSFEGGRLKWQETSSYSKTKTKEYDEIATNHLLFVTMPLVTGYGAYSLVHMKHKSWHSWILSTLVGFIYMFGFVMMTPQLFINYKLQSVAHLNWRTMTYKSLNTFIDDMFAFVIKMPVMHRLACLRDDVIFLVFLYQMYQYRTDYTRVNEFGQCAQPTEEMLEEAEKAKLLKEANSAVVRRSEDINGVVRRRGAREKD